MMPITEPVTSCTIIFRYLYWAPDRKSKIYYEDKFHTIPQLRAYFKRFPAAGGLVGYGKSPVGAMFAFEASLRFEWTDQTTSATKEFTNVFAFTNFLKENPSLARCVEYEAKG